MAEGATDAGTEMTEKEKSYGKSIKGHDHRGGSLCKANVRGSEGYRHRRLKEQKEKMPDEYAVDDHVANELTSILMTIQGYLSLMRSDETTSVIHRERIKNIQELLKIAIENVYIVSGALRNHAVGSGERKGARKAVTKRLVSHGRTFNDAKGSGDELPRKRRTAPNGKMILVVDDEDRVLDVNREILEAVGYKVLAARNGNEAVEIYRAHRNEIELVLLDLIMPGMNGFETYGVLKEMNPAVKVIIVSAFSAEGHVSELLRRGCRAFVRKPFEIEYFRVS